ncbi:transcriptional regulator, MarR family [Actinacidiphila yanglinensis]|uniref:Transcriptional regulator, MarR family n=1 Tax=Actinacidiphila yanglinensis TaxID=310779 RepID=A0A1H5ZDU5_9ACTN|nr:MarR family transcriptional regulator [Actinacidiphila yanglinensis]SEG33536.1 transcriptional regulator, MarR family [Actinacidiphila yanglinensis]
MSFPPPPFDDSAVVRRSVNRLARRMRAERLPDSLPSARLAVLAQLYRGGSSTPGAVAAALHVQPQSLTRTLAALREDGLVTRSRDEVDGRQYVLELTRSGFEAMARDVGYRDAWLRRRMAAELNETEVAVLRLAATLLDRLAADDTADTADTDTQVHGGSDPNTDADADAD